MHRHKQDASPTERIVITAERMIRRHGFRKTTIADIASEALMSPANVYRFFGSKDEVRQAVISRMLVRHYQLAGPLLQLPQSPSARVRRLLRLSRAMTLRLFRQEPHLFELVVLAIRSGWEVLDQHIEIMIGALEATVDEGMARGEFRRQDARKAASSLLWTTAVLWHPVLIAGELKGARTRAVRNRTLRADRLRTYAARRNSAGRRSDRNPLGI